MVENDYNNKHQETQQKGNKMFYNPPMSYYEPNDLPEYESKVADEFYVVTCFEDGDSFGDSYTAEELKDYYEDTKNENEELEIKVVKIEVYEIYEEYYEDKWGDEEVVKSEVGELIHTEMF